MKNRDIQLDEYGISWLAYRELKYFCLQHDEKKQKIQDLCSLSAITYNGMPHGTSISDPTATSAEKLEKLQHDTQLIEQSAIQANSDIYRELINAVTHGMPYEHLNIPCGRRQFYEARRKFFYILYHKING